MKQEMQIPMLNKEKPYHNFDTNNQMIFETTTQGSIR